MRMSFPTPTRQDEPNPESTAPCESASLLRDCQPAAGSQPGREAGRLAGRHLPCPACSGPLLELRGLYRCTRCYFTLCVGCEAADASSYCALSGD
jgi:hypothetical protein